jgi:hypothetical protein
MDLCTIRDQHRVWFWMVSSQGGCLCESAWYVAQQSWATQTVERLTTTTNSYHQYLQLAYSQVSAITVLQNNRLYSLWIKPKDALNSNLIGITNLHVSGSLSAHHQEFLAVYRQWYDLCSLVTECYQAQDGTAPGSTRSPNCINCTNADVRLRTPEDGQKDCPKHVES